MKPARNSIIGYSYQVEVIFFLLSKMDVEREIDSIEIESNVQHQFDDAKIILGGKTIHCQMKDIGSVELKDIKIGQTEIIIGAKSHSLSSEMNVLFFKHIDIPCNTNIFGVPAYAARNIIIVSLSRVEVQKRVSDLYSNNSLRGGVVDGFLAEKLDKRKFKIERVDLPSINVFRTDLIEPTVNISRATLAVENILLIEGKPGIGKSHLVNCLIREYSNNIVYRFWLSNQDKEYRERLSYTNFLADFSKKLFHDLVHRSEGAIIDKLSTDQKTVIIDGLDHIENYNNHEITNYVNFLEELSKKCKIIVLSRPLKIKLSWPKQTLDNWNKDQTKKVLIALYHINDNGICTDIFTNTKGYPILVKFFAEHYKTHSVLPDLKDLNSIDDYYNEIVKNIEIKRALLLFNSARSFFMRSEISMLLGDYPGELVEDFVSVYPYLFELRLNRVSLFHDSFNTFLSNLKIHNSANIESINDKVFTSIITGEKRYLSRFLSFDLGVDRNSEIIRKYSAIKQYHALIANSIDYEAVRAFYFQIRECLGQLSPQVLEIQNYYDLSLILNIVGRDHVGSLNEFNFTFVESLLNCGISEEEITSSDYLFAMFYFVKTSDFTLLQNRTNNDHFDTRNFRGKLTNEVRHERLYFDRHTNPLSVTKDVQDLISGSERLYAHDILTNILENVYLHETSIPEFLELQNCVKVYINIDRKKGIRLFEKLLPKYGLEQYWASMILIKVYEYITSIGVGPDSAKYREVNLRDFILNNHELGSFKMQTEILNYLRLALRENRKIDIISIGLFWPMYHEHKDYSVINMDVALSVFEQENLITTMDSIFLVTNAQEKSDKGIRHLLASYVDLHPPEIVALIMGNFDINALSISWFDLSHKHIDVFPDHLFNFAIDKILHYHRSFRKIELREVENVLHSNRRKEFLEILKIARYQITIDKKHSLAKELKKHNCVEIINENDSDLNKYDKGSQDRFERGILSSKDIDFIRLVQIGASEIAGYTDGYYSVLSDLEIYKLYDKRIVKENIRGIFYNAILGKIRSINTFGNVYHFVGNLPKMVVDYEVDTSVKELRHSFMEFLRISMLLNTHTDKT